MKTYSKPLNAMKTMGLENPFILIDTNHDNSGKQYMEQIRIVRQTLQNRDWNEKIKKTVRGFMIESYLADGRQNQPEIFGCSITDPCLGWENTEALVEEIYVTLTK
ncbi:phospho-2-dehydro-3-deoxyheptonate aldolase, (DAHP synthetase)-possibly tyr-sensitive [Streptococcus pneumoniae]|nr:phospho-2-dehydro-3-deoxyheptonate aldolase, (DAHP synthetase)-possibly tyr-sensitive [Streptococcus pneumoniae]